MGRPVVHFEVWTENPQPVADFYSEVFAWNINHIQEMNYHLADPGGEGGIGGGIMTSRTPTAASSVSGIRSPRPNLSRG